MNLTINIPPMPQSRPRFTSRGDYTRAYEDKKMTAYKNAVADCVRRQKGADVLTGNLSLVLDFYVETPNYLKNRKKSQERLKNEQIWCGNRPDLDNYIKAILDACNGVLYLDDNQIVMMSSRKVYSLDPRTEIKIEILEEK